VETLALGGGVTTRFFGRTSRQSRTLYAVDAGLAVGFAAITITGLGISTWLDLSLASYAAWRAVHVVASVGPLALVVPRSGCTGAGSSAWPVGTSSGPLARSAQCNLSQ